MRYTWYKRTFKSTNFKLFRGEATTLRTHHKFYDTHKIIKKSHYLEVMDLYWPDEVPFEELGAKLATK